MARKKYRPWVVDQAYLFPPTARDWLPEDHLVFFVRELVCDMDIEPIEWAIHRKDPRGEAPYDPRMMLALWLYAYASGVHSSRALAKGIVERVDFRVLAGDNRPHWTTLNTFRREHRGALKHCFLQVLKVCQDLGLVGLGHVAIDGTKVKADASKHKAMSYGRMKTEVSRLEREVDLLMTRSDEIEAAEDRVYGTGDGGHNLPAELKHRATRMQRIRESMAALAAEAAKERARELRRNAASKRASADARPDPQDRMARSLRTKAKQDEAKADELDGGPDDEPPPPPQQLPKGGRRHVQSGEPHDQTQRNFTDPESRIMKGRDGFIQAYNCQAAVDDTHQIIVAADVSNQAPDSHMFAPMLRQVAANIGVPDVTSGDCGYWSNASAESARELGTTALIPLGRTKRWKPGEGSPNAPPGGETPRERMAQRMETEAARTEYRKRGRTVEPVFGQIKEVTRFRQFSFRGLAAVASEWLMVCIGHNIRKAWRHGAAAPV